MLKPHLVTMQLTLSCYEPDTMIGMPLIIPLTAVAKANRSADRLQDVLAIVLTDCIPEFWLYFFDAPLELSDGENFIFDPEHYLGGALFDQWAEQGEHRINEQHQLNLPLYGRDAVYGYFVGFNEAQMLGSSLTLRLGIEGA